jgi:transposase
MDAGAFQQLQLENQQLRLQLAERDRRIAELEQRIRDLLQRLDTLERSVKRQAAPFAKGKPKKRPKPSGRKSGEEHGKHGHRQPPPEDQVEETLDAPLPERCPDCGGEVVEDDQRDQQFQTEISRKPIIRKFDIHCGHCARCGKSLRGRHPLQTSDATGAAQSQVGPDAQAAVVDLNKRAGLSHGKIADTFARLFDIHLTRGACAQIALRAGRRLTPVYEQIRQGIRAAKHLTPDETGWRIGGHPVWLHTWVADDGNTCFVIDPHRGADVLANLIGWDWSGTMTHDGWSAYDRFVNANHQQCVDHLLRRARALVDKQHGAARRFPRQVLVLFRHALRLRDRSRDGHLSRAALDRASARCSNRLFHLTERRRHNQLNEALAAHLYHYGEQWFTFLDDLTVPATNHRGEQALRGPIVNRKVWGGNRTPAGAQAQAITSSVLQTCKNKALDAFTFLSNAFRGLLGNLATAGAN